MSNTNDTNNRDLSWLSFNERVLMEAEDTKVPLGERIKFLAIFSSNLDEFFRVRVAGIIGLIRANKKNIKKQLNFNPEKVLKKVIKTVHGHQERYGKVFYNSILPELQKHKIMLYYGRPILKSHVGYCRHLFRSNILSGLQPVVLNEKSESVPFLENRKIYFFVKLRHLQEADTPYYAIVNVPCENMDRMVQLPSIRGYAYWVFLDDVIRENIAFLFPGFEVLGCYSVKLNRDADLELDEAVDLLDTIKSSLKKRGLGLPSRFLYDQAMDAESLDFISRKLKLSEDDLFKGGRYHNLSDLMAFTPGLPANCYNKPMVPLEEESLENTDSIFDCILKKDYLLHFPYQSYDYILSFFNEAAVDPRVTEIKATFYRVANNSFIANALISAAKNGKKVTAFFELKARFDEENNLKWAQQLQEAGVLVVFSDTRIKVHAKAALITRKDGDEKRNFAFLGTGNFNEKTAGIYADHGLLTANKALTDELKKFFKVIINNNKAVDFQKLLVPNFNLIQAFEGYIDEEIARAKKGKKSGIIIKINNLQSQVFIDKLYEASQAGVPIDLIIRGICCLKPNVPGLSENIRVTRLVDKYLEHARIFYFYNRGEERILMGSADWMDRNIYKRLEIIFPIENESHKEVIKKLLDFQLQDNTKASWFNEKLENIRKKEGKTQLRAQQGFYDWLAKPKPTFDELSSGQ